MSVISVRCKDFFENNNQSIIALLPCRKAAHRHVIQRQLEQYHTIINVLRESLLALFNKDLDKFNGCVGENACQIRAIMMVDIATNLEYKGVLSPTLTRLEEVAQKIIIATHEFSKAASKVQDAAAQITEALMLAKQSSSPLGDETIKLIERLATNLKDATTQVNHSTASREDAHTEFRKVLSYLQSCIQNEVESSIESYINDLQLNFKISKASMAALLSYILGMKQEFSVSIHDTKEQSFKRFTTHPFTELEGVEFFAIIQKQMDLLCIDYVQHAVKKLPQDLKVAELTSLISTPEPDSCDTRVSVPCFASTSILVEYSLQLHMPFLLIINNSHGELLIVLYKASHEGYTSQKLSLVDLLTIERNKKTPVIAIEAYSSRTPPLNFETIKDLSLQDILLANEAVRKQRRHKDRISWPSDSSLNHTKERFEKYYSMGKNGFSEENPQQVYIQHLYPDTLQNQSLKLMKYRLSVSSQTTSKSVVILDE